MFIGMLLETLSIGLVVPAITLLSSSELPDFFMRSTIIAETLSNYEKESLILYGITILGLVYAVKLLFLAFLAYIQAAYVFDIQAVLSENLFKGYLKWPYSFHLLNNSAQLIRNVTSEVTMFTKVMQSTLVILTEGLVFIGITILLLCIEPFGAFVVISTFLIAGSFFYYMTKEPLLRWGEKRQSHEGFRIQRLQEGLGGIKDVMLLGVEEYFIKKYNIHNVGAASVGKYQSMFQSFPRLWIEFLAIAGLVCLVFVVIGQGKSVDTLLPMLGLFVAAAFRIMPSGNRMLGAIQSLRYSLPVINKLHDEFALVKNVKTSVPENKSNISFANHLVIKGLNYKYPNEDENVLHNISLTIKKGTMVGFVGTTGSGKSTLIDLVLGLLEPGKGSVFVDGTDIKEDLSSWQKNIGYVPQSIFLIDDTIKMNIAFGVDEESVDEEAVLRALKSAQLEQFIGELKLGLETIVGERGIRLSGGQRQRIGIARALYNNPDILVLDEATSSLDNVTEKEVMDAVNKLHGSKTVLIIAHRLSTLENCEQIIHIENGQIKNIEERKIESKMC